MFPLNWNIPFIRKNGSRTTLGAITGDIAGIEEEITTIDHYVSGEVIVGDSVPIGCSNASGTEIYLAVPLPKRVLSAVTVSTPTINLSWARADGSSITTGLTVNRVNLSRPNVLGITIGGTFTPLTLYAVSLNIANVTIP